MNTLQEIAQGLCYVTIACAIIDVISPEDKIKKVFSVVVSAFILLSVVMSVSQGVNINDFDYSKSSSKSFEYRLENFNGSVENQVLDITKEKIIEYIDDKFENNSIETKNIEIDMDILEDNSISIECITIIIEPEYREKSIEIIKILKEEFGNELIVKIK